MTVVSCLAHQIRSGAESSPNGRRWASKPLICETVLGQLLSRQSRRFAGEESGVFTTTIRERARECEENVCSWLRPSIHKPRIWLCQICHTRYRSRFCLKNELLIGFKPQGLSRKTFILHSVLSFGRDHLREGGRGECESNHSHSLFVGSYMR